MEIRVGLLLEGKHGTWMVRHQVGKVGENLLLKTMVGTCMKPQQAEAHGKSVGNLMIMRETRNSLFID